MTKDELIEALYEYLHLRGVVIDGFITALDEQPVDETTRAIMGKVAPYIAQAQELNTMIRSVYPED